jgi:hypothetical protein
VSNLAIPTSQYIDATYGASGLQARSILAQPAVLNKRERIYQGSIDAASIRIWLRDPVA